MNIVVRRAVEAVAADAVRVGDALGDRVAPRRLGHRGVVGRVEDGDLRAAAERLDALGDGVALRRVVQRRDRLEREDVVERRLIDERRLREALAAVHDAVAARVDLLFGLPLFVRF